MRKVIAFAGFLCGAAGVSGCALPVTVTAASYALSGFTLMDSGKTVTDIVLSAAADQDCEMWRLIQDQPICVDSPDGTVIAEDTETVATTEALLAELDGRSLKTSTSY
ncbi:MAG: hypothetical protein HKM95_12045 [Inquilinus sp.]|nr:hypothetical protein [Inquilinus sp.]